ncbi:MAG: C40 family peptidase [Thermoguttaceae bacterium]|nr:C40 family peptidase [Thermoguttaceae bacterium]
MRAKQTKKIEKTSTAKRRVATLGRQTLAVAAILTALGGSVDDEKTFERGAAAVAAANDAASTENEADAMERRLVELRKETINDLRLNVFAWEIDAKSQTVRLETTLETARDAVRKTFASEFPNWRVETVLLPEENAELDGRFFGWANFSTIQIRKEPRYSAELTTQSRMGTPVRILKREGGWLLVQNADGYLGYTTVGSVKSATRDEFNRWVDAKKLIWLDAFGSIYSEPNENSAPISDLTAGNVTVWKNEETRGDFYRVETPDGRLGWIRKSGATEWSAWLEANKELSAERLIATAKRFLGTPYVWGGTSAKGVDCSGLTSLSFYLNGFCLLRDVSLLQGEGVEVDLTQGRSSLKPGDLLIFGAKRADGSTYYRHVAIYLGDDRFIHSATSVRINSLHPDAPDFDAYNASQLIKAVRYVGAPKDEYFQWIGDNPFYRAR